MSDCLSYLPQCVHSPVSNVNKDRVTVTVMGVCATDMSKRGDCMIVVAIKAGRNCIEFYCKSLIMIKVRYFLLKKIVFFLALWETITSNYKDLVKKALSCLGSNRDVISPVPVQLLEKGYASFKATSFLNSTVPFYSNFISRVCVLCCWEIYVPGLTKDVQSHVQPYSACMLVNHQLDIRPHINSYSASHGNWCTATLWNRIMTVQCEGMGEVGSARYEPALLPPCPSIRVVSYSNCQEIHSRQQTGLAV